MSGKASIVIYSVLFCTRSTERYHKKAKTHGRSEVIAVINHYNQG